MTFDELLKYITPSEAEAATPTSMRITNALRDKITGTMNSRGFPTHAQITEMADGAQLVTDSSRGRRDVFGTLWHVADPVGGKAGQVTHLVMDNPTFEEGLIDPRRYIRTGVTQTNMFNDIAKEVMDSGYTFKVIDGSPYSPFTRQYIPNKNTTDLYKKVFNDIGDLNYNGLEMVFSPRTKVPTTLPAFALTSEDIKNFVLGTQLGRVGLGGGALAGIVPLAAKMMAEKPMEGIETYDAMY